MEPGNDVPLRSKGGHNSCPYSRRRDCIENMIDNFLFII
tara:strand:+ start:43 stop:159 length:117 start_codon:yes stop_codon:yes gene_type:complete